jgi:threonine dehydratase
MRVTGWRCRVCGAEIDIAQRCPWRCPNATASDPHHVLALVGDGGRTVGGGDDPLIAYDADLAWAAFADACGIDAADRRRMVAELDESVRRVGGVGFTRTPFERSAALSDAFGFTDDGGVWVKDETHGVGGSHKARHLVTILLHLLAAERHGGFGDAGGRSGRPPLAIASCGNAALAAATLAAAVDWPIEVYVPTWMGDGFAESLDRLGADVRRCVRLAGDPPGDPAMRAFREAVAGGAVPFTVQGPENALALDGGRTIGWEIADALDGRLDRVFVQVGGGAFAACLGAGLRDAVRDVHLLAVQAEGCAPLRRAWDRAGGAVEGGASALAPRWGELMTPWRDPHSLADGILDDETYDWLGVVDAIGRDAPVVATEADIDAAWRMARSAGFDVSPTGSAGLAGLLATVHTVAPTERVAVVMSGVAR